MNIYDLNVSYIKQKFDKELSQEYFWDLTQSTFKSRNDIPLKYWVVQPDEEMRIDMVCYRIYGNTNYIDILLNINMIDNPLNIKSGDLIKYPSQNNIDSYRVIESQKQLVQRLLNTNKSSKKDNNRKNYIDQNFSLPPTVLPYPIEPVVISGDNIVIGGGLLPS